MPKKTKKPRAQKTPNPVAQLPAAKRVLDQSEDSVLRQAQDVARHASDVIRERLAQAKVMEEAQRQQERVKPLVEAAAAMETEKDKSFVENYHKKLQQSGLENKNKATREAFIEFFDLAAKLNEVAHALNIRSAVLDAENGEVNVVYQTGSRAPSTYSTGSVSAPT